MPLAWEQQPFETIEAWINAILDEASEDLDEWETDFINDMKIRVQNRWPLTQRQERKIEMIYAEKTH